MDHTFKWTGKKVKYWAHDWQRKSVVKRRNYEERDQFEIDRSRIVHSAAFRRLQGKTQVFTAGEGDFFRTRLTHSLEVAQIGKGLALRLKADADLVETISLAHDIGHPPFGHAGESELKSLMMPYGGFEANAQNIRILTKLETKSGDYDGLNLTRAVIDGQMKYKEIFCEDRAKRGKQRKFIYEEDMKLAEWAGKEAQMAVEGFEGNWKSFECEIMDWADDIAYAVHDLEDSIHAGYISRSTFRDDPRWQETIDTVTKDFKGRSVNVREIADELSRLFLDENPDFRPFTSRSSHKESKASRKQLTSLLIGRYIKSTDRQIRGELVRDAISERYLYKLVKPIDYEVEVALLKTLVWKLVIDSTQVRTLEEKAKHIIRCLFEKFVDEDKAKYLLPDDWKELVSEVDSKENKARVVCDYISGMTDDFAQKTYARLFLPNQGSIYDLL